MDEITAITEQTGQETSPIEVQPQLWETARINITDDDEESIPVIWVHGVAIGTFGNFSASIGKAKSKKTFNVSAMVATAISDNRALNYDVDLPEGRDKILYVDTEQGKSHCLRVFRRILKLAGLPQDSECDKLIFLSLRKYKPEERIRIIEDAITNINGIGLVVIDGVRDLLYDINSPSEATEIISKLMKWTDEHQFHLHTILHQNKADENARGHIGTEINNKAETVIQVEKDKDDSDISTVLPIHTRAAEFEPFAFRINEDALPELASDYEFHKAKPGRPKKEIHEEYTVEQHKTALAKVFPTEDTTLGFGALLKGLMEAYGVGGNKAGKIRDYHINKRIICHEGRKYYLNPLRHF